LPGTPTGADATFSSAFTPFSLGEIETDAQRLYDTLLVRSQAFRALAESRRRAVTEVDRRYGLWLRGQSADLGLPWISSHPWDTLAARLLAAVRTDA
jgi:hypothetical protein